MHWKLYFFTKGLKKLCCNECRGVYTAENCTYRSKRGDCHFLTSVFCPLAFFHVDPGQPRHRDHGIHCQPRILPVSQRGCKQLWKMITTATRKPCVLHSTREYPRSFIEMKLLLELQLAPVEASKKQRCEKAETLLCQQRSV